MALICCADTNSSGAGVPLNVTETPPRLVGTMPLAVKENKTPPAGVDGPMLVPKRLTISPGAIGAAWRLAALVIAMTAGPETGPTVSVTLIVWLVIPGEDTVTVPV